MSWSFAFRGGRHAAAAYLVRSEVPSELPDRERHQFAVLRDLAAKAVADAHRSNFVAISATGHSHASGTSVHFEMVIESLPFDDVDAATAFAADADVDASAHGYESAAPPAK